MIRLTIILKMQCILKLNENFTTIVINYFTHQHANEFRNTDTKPLKRLKQFEDEQK